MIKSALANAAIRMAFAYLSAATTAAASSVLATGVYEGHTYRLMSASPFEAAVAEAITLDGYLTAVSSAGENLFIASMCATVPTDCWIGRRDNEANWVNGELVVFTAWNDGEPNSGAECCVVMNTGGSLFAKWNDLDGSLSVPWVLETNVVVPEPSSLLIVFASFVALVPCRRRMCGATPAVDTQDASVSESKKTNPEGSPRCRN